MDPSISTFLSAFRSDIFRGNRYEVFIPDASQDITVKCHTATLPQRALLTSEIFQNSAGWRIPYSASFDPVSFSFYADERLDTRRYFETWQQKSCDFKTNTMKFLEDYVKDVKIRVYNRQSKIRYSVMLLEAWVMNIGSVDLSYSSVNTAASITVTLAYKQWYTIGGGAGGVGAVDEKDESPP